MITLRQPCSADGVFDVYLTDGAGVCSATVDTEEAKNTGFTTLLNFGQPIPPALARFIFAHEFGHNLGSPVS